MFKRKAALSSKSDFALVFTRLFSSEYLLDNCQYGSRFFLIDLQAFELVSSASDAYYLQYCSLNQHPPLF